MRKGSRLNFLPLKYADASFSPPPEIIAKNVKTYTLMLLMVSLFFSPLTQEYVGINIYNSKYVSVFLVQNCLFMQLNL